MTDQDFLKQRYGNPLVERKTFEAVNMEYWDIPLYYNTMMPALPNKLYCNHDIVKPLMQVFNTLCETGYYKEIKTFDGCYNVRLIRGSKTNISIHSWGLAIDLNAADNPLGYSNQRAREAGLKPFTPEFVSVWKMNGFTWGGDFNRQDGMHFEYVKPLRG